MADLESTYKGLQAREQEAKEDRKRNKVRTLFTPESPTKKRRSSKGEKDGHNKKKFKSSTSLPTTPVNNNATYSPYCRSASSIMFTEEISSLKTMLEEVRVENLKLSKENG